MPEQAELLTKAELQILDRLKDATIEFFSLPEHHPNDCQEWAIEVHHLQQRIMKRAAIRWLPGYFTQMEDR